MKEQKKIHKKKNWTTEEGRLLKPRKMNAKEMEE